MTRRIFLSIIFCALAVSPAYALTLEWDRNSEPDVKEYGVFMCSVPGCTVVMSPATRIGTVSQPLAGVKPTWPIAPNTQGVLAVNARDFSQNESGLSVAVFFDAVAPGIPANLVLK
jgi:hypothetical protein